MAYIVIKGIVSHNGKVFKKEDEVTGLKKEDAERLLELGVVAEDKRKPATRETSNQTE